MADTIKIILLGPPGAGKGTQAANLVKDYGLCHLSTGDMLRAMIASGSPLGEEIKSVIDQGKLVDDQLIGQMIEQKVKQPECQKGFMLDGFPRNVKQAQMLQEILSKNGMQLTAVLEFSVEDSLLTERICGRLFHTASGRSYHEKYNPPKVPMKDDITGENLIRRSDDNEDTLCKRLETYHSQTAPLIEFYSKLGLLKKIDASLTPVEVDALVKAAICK